MQPILNDLKLYSVQIASIQSVMHYIQLQLGLSDSIPLYHNSWFISRVGGLNCIPILFSLKCEISCTLPAILVFTAIFMNGSHRFPC